MPTMMPKGMNNNVEFRDEKSTKSGGAWQMWHQNGTRCPKGTVPIRRSTVHDVLRAKSLYEYGKKQRRSPLLFRHIEPPDVTIYPIKMVCSKLPKCPCQVPLI
jgi:hypothetical protein